jgi:hypothetical protein
MSHSDVESMIEAQGRELLRRLFQDHLALRAPQERELGVEGPATIARKRSIIATATGPGG